MMDKSEENLIFDVLSGDANAFSALVKRYQKPIYHLMVRFTFSETEAFDLTQETFVRAYQKLEQFKPSRRFFPWLYTIGLNLARDHLRKSKRARHTEEEWLHLSNPQGPESPEEARLLPSLDFRRVEESLKHLPLETREAIFLRFHEGMAMEEIAGALGVTVSGAKMKIHRGLLKLRQLLAGEPDHGK